ncbi:MAG: hypothetical protein QXS20_05355 [Candidatus Thorarchaeota archaeon]
MGCRAEGAAQGFTVLGAVVLLVYAVNLISQGLPAATGGNTEGIIDVIVGIVLIIICILSLDACGFVHWKVERSGILLAIFGLFSIFIVVRGIQLNILSWLMSAPLLAGFMILLAGILIVTD